MQPRSPHPNHPSLALLLAACRNQDRVGSRQFAAAYMLVTREEVEEGMEEHWNCPDQLKQWLKKEAGPGTTAQQFL